MMKTAAGRCAILDTIYPGECSSIDLLYPSRLAPYGTYTGLRARERFIADRYIKLISMGFNLLSIQVGLKTVGEGSIVGELGQGWQEGVISAAAEWIINEYQSTNTNKPAITDCDSDNDSDSNGDDRVGEKRKYCSTN